MIRFGKMTEDEKRIEKQVDIIFKRAKKIERIRTMRKIKRKIKL